MPDPLEDLRTFTAGPGPDPLPAAEVRRRGERRRRRGTALAVGGVAAVAALVVPLSLAVRGEDRTAPPVATSPSPSASASAVPGIAWRQRIPADVDLTALPASATFAYTPRAGAGVDPLDLCGTTVFGTSSAQGVVDRAGAVYAEGSSAARTLALYRTGADAARALAAVERAVRACPVQRQPPGAPLVHRVVASTLPVERSLVFTQQARLDARLQADLTVFQVARVGNALYVASSSTTAGGPAVVAHEVDLAARWSAPVLSDLCAFDVPRC